MRVALVVNPGSGADDRGAAIEHALAGHGVDVEAFALQRLAAPHGLDRLADALAGVDRVVVGGGDGSVGPVAALARALAVPLAVIPVGTANDFARWFGLPLEFEEAVALAADPAAQTAHAELAETGGRPFVNVASAGLAVLAADRARSLKPRLGRFAYAVGALRAGLTGGALRCRVRCDGQEVFGGRAWQLVVAATGAFGGGSATGGVDRHDGRLDVAIVAAGPRVALVRRALAMRRGRLVEDPGVAHHRGRRVEVEVARRTRFNVDGELLRPRGPGPARFVLTGGFEVVVRRPAERGAA